MTEQKITIYKNGKVLDPLYKFKISDVIIQKDKCYEITELHNFYGKSGFLCILKPNEYYQLQITFNKPDNNTCIHYIPTSDLYMSYMVLHDVCEGINGFMCLSQEQIEYIKTIKEFKNGSFYFNGEDENELNKFIKQNEDIIMSMGIYFCVLVLILVPVFLVIDHDAKPKYMFVCINGVEYIENKSFKSVVPSYNHDGTIKECRDTIGS